MAIYTEKIIDKITGKKIDRTIDGKKIYYIRTYITDEYGNRKQITRHNKNWMCIDGKREAMAEENRLQNKTYINAKNISFKELCNLFLDYQKEINKESTYYTYYQLIWKWIIPYFNKKTKDLSQEHFLSWRDMIDNQSLSVKSKNTIHVIMSNILKYGIKYNYITNTFEQNLGSFREKNETVKTEFQKIRYITYEQFKTFTSYVDDINWKTFFVFLYYTGMRKGEAQALTWEDIDFDNNQILVTKNLTSKTFGAPYKITNTKTKENRKVDMDLFLKNTLLKYHSIKSRDLNFSIKKFCF